jgi:hypothetical protein
MPAARCFAPSSSRPSVPPHWPRRAGTTRRRLSGGYVVMAPASVGPYVRAPNRMERPRGRSVGAGRDQEGERPLWLLPLLWVPGVGTESMERPTCTTTWAQRGCEPSGNVGRGPRRPRGRTWRELERVGGRRDQDREQLDAAIRCTQARAALAGLGWKPAIARAAVDAAAAVSGPDVTLERLIFESLRRCPTPKA